MPTNYHLITGLEIHSELKTKSKMFCGCKNDPFGADQPNIYTCPVCLGMPGALPVANKTAIEWTILIGLALGCKINRFSKFDRKHYFYPDLPKGYQISQYDVPFCHDGLITTSQGDVRIRRIHLEEDTGKLIHTQVDGQKVSLIDFNRSSVPLVEIVTEPDIRSAAQAAEVGKKLRSLLRYLEVSDCDMERGGMRLEANVSLQANSAKSFPNYKVEIKNINSFKFLETAIDFEVKRQSQLLDNQQQPIQETRGYNQTTQSTFAQRSKEEAEDYRYFPDPDLPPIHFSEADLAKIASKLPQAQATIQQAWQEKYQLSPQTSEFFAQTGQMVKLADEVFALATTQSVNVLRMANEIINKKLPFAPNLKAEEVLKAYLSNQTTATVSDTELESLVQLVINQNPDAVSKFQAGQTQVLGFLIGQVARAASQKLNPKDIKSMLERVLG